MVDDWIEAWEGAANRVLKVVLPISRAQKSIQPLEKGTSAPSEVRTNMVHLNVVIFMDEAIEVRATMITAACTTTSIRMFEDGVKVSCKQPWFANILA